MLLIDFVWNNPSHDSYVTAISVLLKESIIAGLPANCVSFYLYLYSDCYCIVTVFIVVVGVDTVLLLNLLAVVTATKVIAFSPWSVCWLVGLSVSRISQQKFLGHTFCKFLFGRSKNLTLKQLSIFCMWYGCWCEKVVKLTGIIAVRNLLCYHYNDSWHVNGRSHYEKMAWCVLPWWKLALTEFALSECFLVLWIYRHLPGLDMRFYHMTVSLMMTVLYYYYYAAFAFSALTLLVGR